MVYLQPTAILRESALAFYDEWHRQLGAQESQVISSLCHRLIDRRNSRFCRSMAAQYRRSAGEWNDLAKRTGVDAFKELASTLDDVSDDLMEVSNDHRSEISLDLLLEAQRIAEEKGVVMKGLEEVVNLINSGGLKD